MSDTGFNSSEIHWYVLDKFMIQNKKFAKQPILWDFQICKGTRSNTTKPEDNTTIQEHFHCVSYETTDNSKNITVEGHVRWYLFWFFLWQNKERLCLAILSTYKVLEVVILDPNCCSSLLVLLKVPLATGSRRKAQRQGWLWCTGGSTRTRDI